MPETIAIASDHAGIQLKDALKSALMSHGFVPEDMGPHSRDSVDYPDFAGSLSTWVLAGKERRGVLICGSGIGMSMAANRHKGIRAALCRSVEDAELARRHNDANILCLGERITPEGLAKEILAIFLATPFDGGRHTNRITKLG